MNVVHLGCIILTRLKTYCVVCMNMINRCYINNGQCLFVSLHCIFIVYLCLSVY